MPKSVPQAADRITDLARLPWRTRAVLALNALDRRVLRLPCDICGDRRRCWRWHIEVFDCPTCGTTIDEFHPCFNRVVPRPLTFSWWPSITTGATSTYTGYLTTGTRPSSPSTPTGEAEAK